MSSTEVDELNVDATPEQIWQAIATGPGIDSWFMGRNEVDPRQAIRTAFGGYTPQHGITAWEPGERLAFGGDKGPDGRFVAYEFLVEGRDRGSAVVRIATSGFLPGDDWADEYDAMTKGNALFFRTLATYLNHFAGRTAVPGDRVRPADHRLATHASEAHDRDRPRQRPGPVHPGRPAPGRGSRLLRERRHHRHPHRRRDLPVPARLPRPGHGVPPPSSPTSTQPRPNRPGRPG